MFWHYDGTMCKKGAVSDQERKKMKKRGDRYSLQTSLIVAALKRLLPVGLNICAPGDQELIGLAKSRFTQVRQEQDASALVTLLRAIYDEADPVSQKDTEDEVRETIRNNLHLQGKVSRRSSSHLFSHVHTAEKHVNTSV